MVVPITVEMALQVWDYLFQHASRKFFLGNTFLFSISIRFSSIQENLILFES
jgi:hypothetical protein